MHWLCCHRNIIPGRQQSFALTTEAVAGNGSLGLNILSVSISHGLKRPPCSGGVGMKETHLDLFVGRAFMCSSLEHKEAGMQCWVKNIDARIPFSARRWSILLLYSWSLTFPPPLPPHLLFSLVIYLHPSASMSGLCEHLDQGFHPKISKPCSNISLTAKIQPC